MKKEIWKDIPDSPGYQVSDMGRVLSFKSGITEICKPRVNIDGYEITSLSRGGVSVTCRVHRLVMAAFKGGSDLTVDHLNMVKTDNRLENLEYVSVRENVRRASEFKTLSSKYPGVCWFKRGKKWKAQIRYGGKKVYLGCFKSELDAHHAYESAYRLHVEPNEI